MAERWLNFRQIQDEVTMHAILDRIGHLDKMREKKGGRELEGPCPFHEGASSTVFNVDVDKKMFYCHAGCGGGNLFDLVLRIEEIEPEDRASGVRAAAEVLANWFGIEHSRGTRNGSRSARKGRSGKNGDASASGKISRPTAYKPLNPPLAQPLLEKIQKNLVPTHPYLESRGLTKETTEALEISYCKNGTMRGRVVFPIYNLDEQIVGYAGRWVGPESEIPEGQGKYRFPSSEKNHFYKSHLVYNLQNALQTETDELIVVEGFFGVAHVVQSGHHNVTAIMGSDLSDHQVAVMLESPFKRFTWFMDGDEKGKACTRQAMKLLAQKRHLRVILLEEGESPDNIGGDRIQELLG